ncbi:MAG: hypothetical protein IPH13_22560 [Planctomycetes bacterium]|nr:hypothetical protein [Planctomycetota bacterium]
MAPILVQQISPSAAGFGHPMKSITDLDGDGRRELIAREVDSIVTEEDSVRVINTSSGKTMYRYLDPYSPVGQFHLFAYPSNIEVIGDVTGDGIDEWIQGFENCPIQPPVGRGIAEVVSVHSMLATPNVIHPPIGPPIQLKVSAGVEFANASYFILASYTGTSGLTLWNVPVPLRFDTLTELSIAFANTAVFGQTFGTLSSEGTATAFFVTVRPYTPVPSA